MIRKRAHPRWRGAHARARPRAEVSVGSSPLARGTFPASVILIPMPGLIPAGAGHICGRDPPCTYPTAHPRWRGAHVCDAHPSSLWRGSSPLARGTLVFCHPVWCGLGLIPAGAGHIRPTLSNQQPHRAHPRWRGAHVVAAVRFAIVVGSSPLARGTWCGHAEREYPHRLIPAGAGHMLEYR